MAAATLAATDHPSDRIRQAPTAELTAGWMGAVMIGVLLWASNSDSQAIWVLALALAFAIPIAVVIAMTAMGGSVGGTIRAFTGLAYAIYLSTLVAIGFTIDGPKGDPGPGTLVLAFFSISAIGVYFGVHFFEDNDLASFLFNLFMLFSVFIFFPGVAMDTIRSAGLPHIAQWMLGVCLTLSAGALTGFFLEPINNGLRIANESQTAWLWFPWAVFLPLAAVVHMFAANLDARLDQFALYLVLTPTVLTGLPAWPLAALIALWQFRGQPGPTAKVAMDRLQHSVPFLWQSCAFPLPGLQGWLVRLGRVQGGAAALEAIQRIQFGTLQFVASRRAARRLANDPRTALAFCGAVAIATNGATLVNLGRTVPAARALAALWRKGSRDDEPLLLSVDRTRTLRPALSRLLARVWGP